MNINEPTFETWGRDALNQFAAEMNVLVRSLTQEVEALRLKQLDLVSLETQTQTKASEMAVQCEQLRADFKAAMAELRKYKDDWK